MPREQIAKMSRYGIILIGIAVGLALLAAFTINRAEQPTSRLPIVHEDAEERREPYVNSLRFIPTVGRQERDFEVILDQLPEDGLFRGEFTLERGIPRNVSSTLFTVLDYQQVPSEVNGERALVHRLDVEPESSLTFDFVIDVPKEPGLHTLVIFVIEAGDLHSETEMFRMATPDFTQPYTIDIIVEGLESSVPREITALPPRLLDNGAGNFGGIAINRGNSFGDSWISETVQGGEPLGFHAYVANPPVLPPTPYLLIGFLDWKQVPIHQGGLFYYGEMTAGMIQQVPLAVEMPLTGGSFELQIIMFTYPHESYHSPQRRSAPGQPTMTSIVPSRRVLLTVP